jgi:hypothetical protein
MTKTIYPPFGVRRFDDNPANTYTFGKWVYVCGFKTRREAEAFVKRASAPTQQLKVTEENV